ncbi:hypothetical protein D918_03518 [Trichuris suis]|nr:hypothetical protein D918_03518 [Trichuris suis]
MISFHVLLFLFRLANANSFWRLTASCPDNTTSDVPDFICTDLLPLCYKPSNYHANKPFVKSDYSLECFLENTSEIRLSVYKSRVELSTNSLSVLSGTVVVKLTLLLPADILAAISKLEAPVLISVQRNDVAQNFNSSNNHVSIVVEQVFSKLTTLLVDGVRLPCALFDRPANFTVCVNAEENKAVYIKHELATCTVLSVHPWKEYAIQMRTDRLFPCEGIGISVSTRTPNCSSDVVLHQLRLLAIQGRQHNPMETKRRGVYVGEQRLQPGVSVVNFHCNYFDLIYPEYCFQMVSVVSDGYVQQHAQRCVSTELKTKTHLFKEYQFTADGQHGKVGALVQVVAMLFDIVSVFAMTQLLVLVAVSVKAWEWRLPVVTVLVTKDVVNKNGAKNLSV